ncbi:MAG TPA: hypothetical protein VGN01_05005 [Acidobacteriaceae bacterium]|jgi:photosystem II stability/assembly factor-like uncharacterized protein
MLDWNGTTPLNRRPRPLCRIWILLIFGFVCPQIHAVSWFPFGPDGGSARAFEADPRDHAHLYLGAANGWIYQSRDGGKKWERLARVGNRDDLVIDSILVDPADPKHLAVGAWVLYDLNHPDGGLYNSSDGGVTWTSQPEMQGQSIRALTYAPSNPKIWVAGTLEGVFRSMDSGAHWERISPKYNAEIHEVESLAIDPADPGIIYAGTWHLPWKTTDGGKTWKSIKQGIIEDSDVFSIVVDPNQSSVVYLSACSGIYKSEDAGAKFVKVQGIPSTARRTRVLMQDPNKLDTVFAGTTEGLYRTFDAGKIWIQTTRPDVIVNDVYIDPADSKHVLLATDRRGVLLSDDGGDSFRPSNEGFSARQITAFAGDAQHPATVYVGMVNDKDAGGVFVSHTGGLSWSHLSDGLDSHDVFSLGQAPDGTMLAGTEHGIYRLKDSMWQRAGGDEGKGSASARTTAAAESRAKPMRKAGHGPAPKPRQVTKVHAAAPAVVMNFDGSVYGFAQSGDTLFAATSQGVLRSASSGVTWSAIAPIAAGEWRFVAAAKQNVVAANLGTVEMSIDGGDTWKPVAVPPKVTQVLALCVDAHGGVWVGDRDGVYFSADKGANWQTLTNLYVRNVNSLYYDEAADRVLVTTNEPATTAFAVQTVSKQVSSWDTKWNLRFMRPVGDHLVAATLFDGIVVQPRMVDSAEIGKH